MKLKRLNLLHGDSFWRGIHLCIGTAIIRMNTKTADGKCKMKIKGGQVITQIEATIHNANSLAFSATNSTAQCDCAPGDAYTTKVSCIRVNTGKMPNHGYAIIVL